MKKYEIELTPKQEEVFNKFYPDNVLGGIMRAIEEKTFIPVEHQEEESALYGYAKVRSEKRECGNCDYSESVTEECLECRLNPPIIGHDDDFSFPCLYKSEHYYCGQFKPKINRG